MKKASLLTITSFLFAAGSFCQQKVFSCDYTGYIFEAFTTSIIPNTEKDFFIFSLVTDHSVKRYYSETGKNFPLLEQNTIPAGADTEFMYHSTINEKLLLFYRKLVFAGGIYRNKKIIEVMRSRLNNDMYLFETDLTNGSTYITDTIKCGRSETIISCSAKEQGLTIITYLDGTNMLNIYKKQKEGLKKTPLNILLPGENENRHKTISISKKHFGVYDNNQRYHVLFASPPNKAFIQKGRVVIILTENDADVYAVEVNTGDETCKAKKFSPGAETADMKMKGASAFLIDSLLVTCYAAEKKLGLAIYNLDTEQTLLSETIDENNIEQFEVNPILRTGSFMSKSDIKETKFNKFYSTIKNNALSVSGYTDNGKLFLSFGSEYKQLINGTVLLNLLLTAAGTYFINASSDYYGYFISGFRGVNNDTYTSFDATLSLAGLKPNSSAPNFSVWERLASFAGMRHLSPSNSNYFYMNNYYYLGYFDALAKRYLIYRFNEKGIE